ncbi:MAG: hypothetical protein ACLP1X_19900 [Polyangiaceae bacterium]
MSLGRDLSLSDGRIPSIEDARWEAWAAALLSFLEEPRDWKAIGAWARDRHTGINFVRHMLAWAEDQRRAESFYRDEILYWAVCRVSSVRLVDDDSDLDEMGERAVSEGLCAGEG